MTQHTIFLIDDNQAFLDLFASLPESREYDLRTFNSPLKAIDAFNRHPAHLVISDIQMPTMSGIDLYDTIHDLAPIVPVILVTAFGSTAEAVQAVQKGAFHYFEKPLTDKLPLFWTTVREALNKHDMLRQLAVYKHKRSLDAKPAAPLIGRSPPMQRVQESIDLVAELPATVLISGETGTGKELVAQSIHNQSRRVAEAFFALNCAEFSPGLLESELFGHERGAFTGAVGQHMGFVEMADGGTLFLDEIGEAPPVLQTKLLRVLEAKHFTRVGGTTAIKSDFRLIAATNQDLDQRVTQGRFRMDLLYRIKVYEINIPPLRQRRPDIPLLADYYLSRYNQDYGRAIEGISEAALKALRDYDWPGNVRELINVIERAVIICREPVITTKHLPFGKPADQEALSTLNLKEIERFYMELALKRTSGNKTQAAALLGISRKTLIQNVKKFHLAG